jgi:5'-nucleotidase
MERKSFIKKAILGTGALLSGGINVQAFAKPLQSNLTILHTNDVHSRLDPFPMDGGKYEGMGGIAARKKILENIRGEAGNYLLLDSGDMFQGTPYFNIYKGEPEIKAMSLLGYEAGTIGNHDFDAGIENLANQLIHANFPIVNCNYDFVGTPLEDKIEPFVIIKKKKLKIGVLGVGIQLHGLVPDDLCVGVTYKDPVKQVNYFAKKLKKQLHCDMVICLSHLGYKYDTDRISDVSLAPQTEYVDVILGGHTHTFLDEPVLVKNKNGKDVMINQVGFGGIKLGRLDFDIFHANSNEINLYSHTVISAE